MPDPDLDLDPADPTTGPLADWDSDVVTVLVQLFGLDRELVEDLDLALERLSYLPFPSVAAAEKRLLRLQPLEVIGEQRESLARSHGG